MPTQVYFIEVERAMIIVIDIPILKGGEEQEKNNSLVILFPKSSLNPVNRDFSIITKEGSIWLQTPHS